MEITLRKTALNSHGRPDNDWRTAPVWDPVTSNSIDCRKADAALVATLRREMKGDAGII